MSTGSIPISKQGYKKLEDELARLKDERPAIIAAIREARAEGDLSENAEYDEAKKEQAKVEEEITRLTNTLRTARVVNDEEITTEKVSIGTTVKIKDMDTGECYTYSIVGAEEADPYEDKISNESPVGKGLIGAKKNEVVAIEIPSGIVNYKILSIKRQ